MTFDQIILTLLLLGIFTMIFGSVYFLPILFAKIKSQKFGLKLDFKQAHFLAKNKCLKKDFLIGLKEIWNIYPIELDKLISHYYAGGNLENLKVGISEMKLRNKEPDLVMLTALDLINRDLKIEVEKAANNEWKFEL